MKSLSEVTKEALKLSPAKRLVLARILLEVAEEAEDFSPATESAWEEEISKRMKAVENGRAESKGFEQVFSELDKRFPG